MAIVLGAIAVSLSGCSQSVVAPAPEAIIARSAPIADRFQNALQGQLRSAMQAGGPVAAVSVCKEAAPAIAAAESEASGAIVRRIALRHRNPDGSVPEDMRAAYAALAAQPIVNGRPAVQTFTSGSGDARRVNFLRAIPMQAQPCAACHGTNVAPAVEQHIRSLYPDDQATGFRAGELRGALLVSWPERALAGAQQ